MNIAIYGTGGAAKEAYELLEGYPEVRAVWDDIVFIDDTKVSGCCLGHSMLPYEEFINKYAPNDTKVYIGVGEPRSKSLLADKVRKSGFHLASLVHPLAMVSPRAKVGEGTMIQDYVTVVSEAVIGDNSCINGRTIIGHNVEIGENCQISSHVAIGGGTVIGNNTFVGLGANIADHIVIGENCVISLGAAVMKNVSAGRIAMGNPAREIADNLDGKIFK